MWVEFTSDFTWTPPENKRIRIAFKKGMRIFVRRKCAAAALEASKAVESTRPTENE